MLNWLTKNSFYFLQYYMNRTWSFDNITGLLYNEKTPDCITEIVKEQLFLMFEADQLTASELRNWIIFSENHPWVSRVTVFEFEDEKGKISKKVDTL